MYAVTAIASANQAIERISTVESAVEPSPGTVIFEFEGTIWHYRNPNTIYFVSLPEPLSSDILELVGTSLNPWGTVPVDVTVGDTTWYTSMFPRDGGRYYDLPIKMKIMKSLKLADGQTIAGSLAIRLPW